MADTVKEAIMKNIKTTLEAIQAGETYNNTIKSVQRWQQKGNSLVLVPCIVINAGPEDRTDDPNPLTSCDFTVYIDVWTRDESDSTDSILNSLFGDIIKALTADITRGGNAVETHILSVVPFETIEGQPYAGIIVETLIKYRHEQTDPETSG